MKVVRFPPILATVIAVGAVVAATTTASDTAPAVGKPVIGQSVTVPAQAVAGKRFTVSFKVTRRDTGAPLMHGRMICAPTVAGKVLPHAESFKRGTARLSLVIPSSTKLLKVKLTITAEGQSATKVTSFRVRGAVLPSLSIADASVAEGNSGATTLSFPVILSSASTETVSVNFETVPDTASAGSDYASSSGKLTFTPGERHRAVAVQVVGDATIESDETFTVVLAKPVNATLDDRDATGTIVNDEVPRVGHYAGTTSQGLPISLDVIAAGHGVTNLIFEYVPYCPYGPGPTQRFHYSADILVRPGGEFGMSDDYADPNGTRRVVFAFSGRLSVPGSAGGSFSFVYEFYSQPGYGTLRCETGEVTWNAS